jgi:putative membrane protein
MPVVTAIPEPSVLAGVLVAGWLYGRGLRAGWARAGRGRSGRAGRAACFAGGLLAVLVALESPLDGWSDALFAAHMVQHLLLLAVAGPLLALGRPLLPFLWAVPEPSRRGLGAWWKAAGVPRRAWHALSRPLAAFGLHSLALWAWHVPPLYEAALATRGLHLAEHLGFLGTALLFWWTLTHAGRAGYGAGVLYVFGMALQSTVLGALLAVARSPWYTSHLATTAAWGLSPLEDQQLAGLIMWVPGGAIYLVAALALFAAWLRDTPAPVARSTPADG